MADKRGREQLNVVVEPEQRAFVERYAKENDLRLAQVVRKAIRLLMSENSAQNTSTLTREDAA